MKEKNKKSHIQGTKGRGRLKETSKEVEHW
jgi:hypothetical protein